MLICGVHAPVWEIILKASGGFLVGLVITICLSVMFKIWGFLVSLALLAGGGFYLQWYITAHGC
jgi:hypothetical protein